MRLPSSLSRPSYLYLVLFLMQLLFTLLWLSSIQREQHESDRASLELPGAGPAGKLRNWKAQMQGAGAGAGSAGVEDKCTARLENAILQLEQLKTELHLTLPSSAVVTQPASAPTTVALPSSSSSRKPFLIIGIPTMPRSADYLSTVLSAIDKQMVKDPQDPLTGMIQVWIMNNVKDEPGVPAPVHDAFNANKEKYAGRSEFVFLQNDHVLQDANPTARDQGSPDFPGWRVRKQTRDIARLMQKVKGESGFYMAMEDDFEICPNTLRILEHAIRKCQVTHPDWVTLKFSYGFNGFMFKNNEDLQVFANYLIEHQARRPPDHLNTEWSCAEKPQAAQYVGTRPHMTYRYNIFTHLGKVSSLRERLSGEYAGCFHDMNTQVVFQVDAFDPARCGHDDMTPCLPADHPKYVTPYWVLESLVKEGNSH